MYSHFLRSWPRFRCSEARSISDKEISLGGSSSVEAGLKFRSIGKGWSLMFAGNDVSHAEDVGKYVGTIVHAKNLCAAPDITDAAKSAYQVVRRRIFEDIHLSSFGWKTEDLLSKGSTLPADQWQQLLILLRTFDLGCSFILCGFNSEKSFHADIIYLENPGACSPSNLIGFAAIGSGASNALSYLTWKNQGHGTSLSQTIYNAIAAKKLSEKALGVGIETSVAIQDRGKEEPRFLGPGEVKKISDIWEREEANIKPNRLNERVIEILKENEAKQAAATT